MALTQPVCLALLAGLTALPIAAAAPVLPPDPTASCPATQSCTTAASDVTGTILIKRKLTKPSVTASVSIYQRGAGTELGKDAPEEDPLSFERARVVIYLEGPTPASDASPAPAVFTMQQLNRRFAPDLLVVPVGAKVQFPNMDPIFHNIFSLSKPKSFDLGSYDKGDSRSVTFSRPGIVYVYCHLHPNMEATIVVAPNRWYARSDASGQYRIPNVLPGHYTVVAWHKSAGFFRKPIVIEPGHSASADFFIPLADTPQNSAMKSDAMEGMGGK